jgi:gamma-glutamylcyclotransferase (GGCT)/AIG2-like uncharacterized protein YtfP
MLRVFVYGTLQPGERYYPAYCEGKVVESRRAIAYGRLYDLPLGYPAMTAGDQPVQGTLLTFPNDGPLAALDDLEDYDPNRPPEENEYVRQRQEIFSPEGAPLGLAWVYLMDSNQVEQLGGCWLAAGKWSEQGDA